MKTLSVDEYLNQSVYNMIINDLENIILLNVHHFPSDTNSEWNVLWTGLSVNINFGLRLKDN